MIKDIYESKFFKITHTLEESGPHPTIPYDYYDNTFTITALLQGSGSCFIEGNSYPLSSGDLVLIGLDEIRSFRFEPEGCHERISLYFSSAVLSPLWEYELPFMQMFRAHPPGIGNKYTPEDYGSGKVTPIFRELCTLVHQAVSEESGQTSANSIQEARIHLLLLQLLFALYDAHEKFQFPARNYKNDPLIWEICRYIHENLTETLTYQHLQEHFSVSRYQLTEVFYRNTGMTLTEYILQKRLIKVASLVRNGSGIEHAAFDAGFRNYSHFYKEFRRHYHISPREYYANRISINNLK